MTTTRISRLRLQELAAQLSQRDLEIIYFLRQQRYATTPQIRRCFFTTHASQGAASRACTKVLGRLLQLRILIRLKRRIGGVRQGSASYVWCLDVVGDRLASPQGDARRRFQEPSVVFLTHTLAITETVVQIREASTAGAFQLQTVQTEPEAWREYVAVGGAKRVLKPDLKLTIGSDKYDDHWYVEVDLGTESLPVLLRKCAAYEEYRRTGRAQAEHGVFPRALWVLPDTGRLERLKAAITREPELPNAMFACITSDRLIQTLTSPPTG